MARASGLRVQKRGMFRWGSVLNQTGSSSVGPMRAFNRRLAASAHSLLDSLNAPIRGSNNLIPDCGSQGVGCSNIDTFAMHLCEQSFAARVDETNVCKYDTDRSSGIGEADASPGTPQFRDPFALNVALELQGPSGTTFRSRLWNLSKPQHWLCRARRKCRAGGLRSAPMRRNAFGTGLNGALAKIA